MSHPDLQKTHINAYLLVSDVDQIVAFYEKAFGFKVLEKVPGEDGKSMHSEMSFANELIMVGQSGAFGAKTLSPKETGTLCPITLCLNTPDVDAFYQHAIKNGAVSIAQPEDQPWGARACHLKDPEGYVWCALTMKPGCCDH